MSTAEEHILLNTQTHHTIEHRKNPYLLGAHAPVHTEITALDLQLIGDLPKDLQGIYLRNGPNPKFSPQGVHHWFDGDGMLHGVEIADGKVSYRNRWVRTEGLAAEEAKGATIWPGLIDRPNRSLEKSWGADRYLKDCSNTDVVFHNGKAVTTFYQCGEPYLLDPHTLETLGRIDLKASGGRFMSAHNMVDEHTSEMMFFDYATVEPYMTYGVLDPAGKLSHFTAIELPGARLPHSLAITEHYTILMDLPLFWDPELLRNDAHKVTFYPDMPSRFGVLGRHAEGASIRWFEAEPCYIYHVINAWEEGDEVILDGCRLEHPEPTQDTRRRFAGPYANLMAWMRLDATYHRWHFNLKTGECREQALNDLISEFPMINGRYLGRPSRYSYHVSFAPEETVLFDGLVRYDSVTGNIQQHHYPAGHYGSESPFAPRVGATAEDDGYVLSFVSVPNEQRAELQVFDGSDISRGPLCRALIPQHIPSGFHACWIASGSE
ncbi:MAG: carotenoid oxygenase family protein [Xanthomonadales bacterium]|nr:carotenoid oxygenase family protein [Xanthomonadales bacterium]